MRQFQVLVLFLVSSLAYAESYKSFEGVGKYEVIGLIKESKDGDTLIVFPETLSETQLKLKWPQDKKKRSALLIQVNSLDGDWVKVVGRISQPLERRQGVIAVEELVPVVPDETSLKRRSGFKRRF